MIEVEDVSYLVDGVTVLDGVSLRVDRGESLALVGPSGSGKSSFIAIMSGLVAPAGGAVRFDGEDIARLSGAALRRRTGVVFQGYALLSLLTAAENVELAQQARGAPGDAVAGEAARALAAVGLAERADHLVEELSGGEQQRVAVARALVGEPLVVLADEPTAELDEANRAAITTQLLGVALSGRTLVLATHDPEVAALCTRTVRLVSGRVVGTT